MHTWQEFRPYGKWVLVKEDPRKTETKGGLVLPDIELRAEKVMEGTGVVLKLGSQVKEVLGSTLEPGHRICFRGFLKDAFHEFKPEDGCRVFLLRAEDVMMVIPKDVSMGMLS